MTTEIGGPCLLRDGSMVEIRQVECGDAPLLADGFARLSVRSRRSRFMRDKNRLTEAELRFLTCIDHHDHEALGALGPDGQGVGVARYIRDPEEPRAAELAITVVDDWQGRGLGSKLLALLCAGPHRRRLLVHRPGRLRQSRVVQPGAQRGRRPCR